MCYFITIGVLSNKVPKDFCKARYLNVEEIFDKNITTALKSPEYKCFLVTSGGCSCDLLADNLTFLNFLRKIHDEVGLFTMILIYTSKSLYISNNDVKQIKHIKMSISTLIGLWPDIQTNVRYIIF